MSKTFLIADTHWGHKNILTFKNSDGSFLRPGFSCIEEHDEMLVQNWNNIVKPGDKVYHLGDVGFFGPTQARHVLSRLNGTKVLIKGNHDNLKLSLYQEFFKDIRAYHRLDKFVLSHIPIHTQSVTRWKANIHGHLHGNKLDSPLYINVSCEQINFTPIDFQDIQDKYK